jgi:hypothetical protein
MAQGRVQVQDLQGNGALRPAPIQSDTFVAPARPSADNRWASLAQSLAGFSSSLGDYASTMKPSEEERQRQIWAAERKMEGLTNDETKQLVDEGKIPAFADKFARQAAHSVAGATRGRTFATELRDQMVKEFDWDAGDPDAFITSKINEYIENSPYKDDPNFGQNFMRSATGLRDWAVKFSVDRKSEQFVEQKGQSAYDYLSATFDQQAELGSDPEKVADLIFSQLPVLGSKGTLGVNEETLEGEVLNLARRYADTNPDHALALINRTRKGRDGIERSFAMDRDKADQVEQIRATAAKAKDRISEAEARQELANRNADLFRNGGMESVEDFTFKTSGGREVTVSKDEQLKAAEDEYLRGSAQIAKTRREAPTEQMFRELRDFRRQGHKHPGIARALGNMVDSASPEILGDPESKERLMGKLDVYRKLRQESKNSITAYTKEEDRDFAEAFIQGTDFLGLSDDAALEFAITTSRPLDAFGREQVGKYQREIDSELNNLATRKNWFGFDSDSDPTNFSTVKTKVTQLAQKFVVGGVEPKLAVTAASKAVKENMTVHNGTMLDLNGLDVPDNFPEAVDEALAQFIAANPKVVERSGFEPEDLTVVPVGGDVSGGRFKIVDRENVAVALHTDKQEVALITLKDIRGMWNRKTQEETKIKLRQDNFNNSVQQKGLVYAVDTDGSKGWVDPKTKELFDYQYTEKDDAPIWKKTGKRYKRAVVVNDDGGPVLKGFDAGSNWGRLRGADLKAYRERMKKLGDDHDAAAAERRKFWGSILPSIKIGDTVLND